MDTQNEKRLVLVTGGAGYLGSHLSRILLKRGFRVRVFDSLWYGNAGIQDLFLRKRFEFRQGDICNVREMTQAIKGADFVVSLAAIVGDPACALQEEETLSVNYESTKILVELCNRHKVQRLLFASSCSVYGANSQIELNEGSILQPVSLYAKTRIMSEDVLRERSSASLAYTIFRLSTLMGWSRRMRFDLVVNTLAAKAAVEGEVKIMGGEQWRPFLHVRDAAECFANALEAPLESVDRQIFNVGGRELNYQIKDLATILQEFFPHLVVHHETGNTDLRDYRVSFDKIASVLNFHPSMSVKESIREIINNLQEWNVDYREDIHYNVKYIFR